MKFYPQKQVVKTKPLKRDNTQGTFLEQQPADPPTQIPFMDTNRKTWKVSKRQYSELQKINLYKFYSVKLGKKANFKNANNTA